MNLFLLLFSSFLFCLVGYVSFIRMPADLRKSYVVFVCYRMLFFVIQSSFFYFIYKNELDTFFYHDALHELFAGFIQSPSDSLLFVQGKYSQLHITEELQIYLNRETRVAFFIKVLFPFFLISAGNYYLMGAWLTLLGTLCFMPFLSLNKKTETFSIWMFVLLIPSFTIWTVGILKEAFVIPILFLAFFIFQKNIKTKEKDLLSIVFFIVLILLAWYVKYYLVALFFIICIIYFIHSNVKFNILSIVLSSVLLACALFGLGYLHPALKWDVFPEVIYIGYNLTCTNFAHSTPCIPFDLDMTWTSIIQNFPKAFLYAFLSPFPWQIHNSTSLLAAIESYVFLILFFVMLIRWGMKKTKVSRIEVLGLLSIFIVGSLLILATPNLGSFSRYRILYLPIYAYIVIKHSGISGSAFLLWVDKSFRRNNNS